MLGFDDATAPHPLTTAALLGLTATLWVFARVQILRRQMARKGEVTPGQAGVTRLGFLHRLAAWRGTGALLGAIAAGFVALLVTSLR